MNHSVPAPFFIGMPDGAEAFAAELVGSKAAQLWQMARLGLRVPPAFVLPTTHCAPVNQRAPGAFEAARRELHEGLAALERATDRRLGDDRCPLLVSVRSGAARSMPGMLDTILDVGLNDASLKGLIRMTGNPRLAWDSCRRFIQGYTEVVHGAPATEFDARLLAMVQSEGVASAVDLDPEALERLAAEFRDIAERAGDGPIPDDPHEQLWQAARAIYASWERPRAREYRRINHLESLAGTAVTIQAMVFGNSGGRSGAGVAFSRNPATGTKELYADYLADAQGEDVVAGRRTPGDLGLLAARLPDVAKELAEGAKRVEAEFRDLQDIEFTVEDGTLYFLQTRSAKRTPRAALRVAVDLVHEGMIDRAEALRRLDRVDLGAAGESRFSGTAEAVASAIVAAPGVACGRAAFDSARAKEMAAKGDPVVLIRHDTSTEDVAGFAVAAGILTAIGGRTAHAAVVARELGKVCLVGCRALAVDEERGRAEIAGRTIQAGDWISLDGGTGEVFIGRRDIVVERPERELAEIARWKAA